MSKPNCNYGHDGSSKKQYNAEVDRDQLQKRLKYIKRQLKRPTYRKTNATIPTDEDINIEWKTLKDAIITIVYEVLGTKLKKIRKYELKIWNKEIRKL